METAYKKPAIVDEDDGISSPPLAGVSLSGDASITSSDTVPTVADPAPAPRARDDIEHVGEANRELLNRYRNDTITIHLEREDKLCGANSQGHEMRITALEYEHTAMMPRHQDICEGGGKCECPEIAKAEAELPNLTDHIHDLDALHEALRAWDQKVTQLYGHTGMRTQDD
ncbi:hypothetical protein IWQ57_001528 [Coemansia nantahalensis]|uniref:Uncharacterized protein n=1 Tax=Coemansia nantahalensis TaxID=2789366 RepID=A0ACC1K461_9FUNG|nr:hypothetical protein IWQ57_001528 [Coemansia nantahalensis]